MSRLKRMRIILFFLLAVATLGSELPVPGIPASMGLNVFIRRGREGDLDQIAAAGFKVLRRDFVWQDTEPARGEYDFSPYDEMLANLEKRGMRALFLLDYTNTLYEPEGWSPQKPESVQAFATWAAAAAAHFRGRHVIWEIWNEPNIGFWKPKPDAKQYATLLIASAKAIRAADPASTIVAPAVGAEPWEYLEAVFKAGTLPFLDAVSLHPYRDDGPEGSITDLTKARELIARYNRGKTLPIVCTEWGWSTFVGKAGVSVETQAQYLVRQQLWSVANAVPLCFSYTWQDTGPAADQREDNYGMLKLNGTPKPVYEAMQNLSRELSGFRFIRRIEVAGKTDWVLLFKNQQNLAKLAVWTVAAPHRIRIPGSSQDVEASGLPKYLSGRGISL